MTMSLVRIGIGQPPPPTIVRKPVLQVQAPTVLMNLQLMVLGM